jgi:ribulose-5-phosphate 4-epimerase/fuculose-1-phosphate aldolase
VRDPEFPDLIWMNPIGRHFALLNASDMLCLDINKGAVVGGNRTRPANAPGFHIHSEIHKARPGDVHAICHAHTIAGVLLNHGLISVGHTVDEAHFLFGLLDRSCEIQLRVEAACAGNPSLKKHIIPDEMVVYETSGSAGCAHAVQTRET